MRRIDSSRGIDMNNTKLSKKGFCIDDSVQNSSVSYTPAYETSARCLRSIYPSLDMRQLFDDVTMGQWRNN